MAGRRTPVWAERTFATRCSASGALCTKVEEDESGWDYLVEFPPRLSTAPADTHPASKKAFVQVKSTEKDECTCRVTLSNALRSASSPDPWFYILIVAGSQTRPTRTYAVHVWEALIRRILERVRKAHNEGRALNRSTLVIRFQPGDEHGEEIVRWIEASIDAIGDEYESRKRELHRTVGYEEGYGTVDVSIEGVPLKEIRDFFLGFGDGVPISKFTYREARFGILSKTPSADLRAGVLQNVTPDAGERCQLRLRGPSGTEPIALDARLIKTGIPDPPPELTSVRVSADFIDLVWSLTGPSEFRVRLDPSGRRGLLSMEQFVKFMEWYHPTESEGASPDTAAKSITPIEVEVWFSNTRVLNGPLNERQSVGNLNWSLLHRAIRLLRSIALSARVDIIVSLEDVIRSATKLLWSVELLEAPSLRAEIAPPLANPPFSIAVYYLWMDIAEYTFYALVERPVRQDVLVDEIRQVTMGPAQMVDSYVLEAASQDERNVMASDYERHLKQQEEVGNPAGFGDIHILLEAATETRAG